MAVRELEAGGILGPYRIVRELGRGGMGVVYEGVHTHLRRRVAIKLMRPELAADPTHVERFVREGRAASRIGHPNVIDVFEFDFSDGVPYLVMDYLDGETLAERLHRVGRLPLPELLATLLPVLSAVAAAHDKGVVHRDLKPHNVMLARDPEAGEVPKVLDFGTSKLLTPEELSLTNSAAMFGTPHYMAPEQARSARDVDARTDQYALGVMLYECATGRRPFEGEHAFELLHAIMSAPVAPPSTVAPELPQAFDAVVLRALARDPELRFRDVRGLGAALLGLAPKALAAAWEPVFGSAAEVQSAPAAAAMATWPQPVRAEPVESARPARRLLPAALAVVVIALLATGWTLLGRARPGLDAVHAAQARSPGATTPAAVQVTAPRPDQGAAAAAPGDHGRATALEAAVTAPAALVPAAEAPPPPIERSARSRVKTATARKPAESRRVSARGPSAAAPGLTLGDNGAPILE